MSYDGTRLCAQNTLSIICYIKCEENSFIQTCLIYPKNKCPRIMYRLEVSIRNQFDNELHFKGPKQSRLAQLNWTDYKLNLLSAWMDERYTHMQQICHVVQ